MVQQKSQKAKISDASESPVVSELVELASRIAQLPAYTGSDLGCPVRRVDHPVGSGRKDVPLLLIGAEYRDAIVRACNSHDALVKALRAVLEIDSHGFAVAPMGTALREQLTAALASAREVQQ